MKIFAHTLCSSGRGVHGLFAMRETNDPSSKGGVIS